MHPNVFEKCARLWSLPTSSSGVEYSDDIIHGEELKLHR